MMNEDYLMSIMTEENFIDVMYAIGHTEQPIINRKGLLFSSIVCHGGNHFKLQWFTKDRRFYCYSECCRAYTIFDLVEKRMALSHKDAVDYVCQISGFGEGDIEINPLVMDIIRAEKEKQMNKTWEIERNIVLPRYYENIFPRIAYKDWIDEGITREVQQEFEVQYFIAQRKIIVPHRQWDTNELIGAIGRNIDYETSDTKSAKWITIFDFNKTYNIYALSNNLENVRASGEIILTESEKSPMKARAMGINNVCALSGHRLSDTQKGILASLGVKIIVALDKDIDWKVIKNEFGELSYFMDVYVLPSYISGYLGDKDSPFDKTREVFEELYKNKRRLTW